MGVCLLVVVEVESVDVGAGVWSGKGAWGGNYRDMVVRGSSRHRYLVLIVHVAIHPFEALACTYCRRAAEIGIATCLLKKVTSVCQRESIDVERRNIGGNHKVRPRETRRRRVDSLSAEEHHHSSSDERRTRNSLISSYTLRNKVPATILPSIATPPIPTIISASRC